MPSGCQLNSGCESGRRDIVMEEGAKMGMRWEGFLDVGSVII